MQFKRILAIFLAAALIFSALTFTVGAETLNVFEVGVAAKTTTPVSTSPVIYNANEEVTVTISAVQNTGFDYLVLKVSYDSEALDYIGYTTNKLFGVDNLETIQEKNGYVIFTAVLNEISTATGDMFTINFKTKDDFCGETGIVAQLVNNDEYNCMITDPTRETIVSFIGDSVNFELHNIDSANGVVTAPTCTEQGYTTYSCANCDMSIVGNYVAANGHSEANAVEENRIEATCTENGSYDSVVYCSVCDVELSRENFVIDAHGHTPLDEIEENRIEADCINNGSYDTVVYCGICDAELSRENFVIDAHGHTPLEAVEENRVEPDCINKGSYDMVVYCGICDVELSRESFIIDALGHDLTAHDSKTPTCTEIGWDAYNTCSRCNYTTYVEKAPIGHDLVARDAKTPTCTEIGWDAYNDCSRCDYTTYVEKSGLGHTYGESTIVEPEYKVEGYTTHTCKVCNHEEKYDITPALTYILGDTNGNEVVDSEDAINLLYYTLLPESISVNQNCDFDGDGDVDSDDAIYLLYYTLLPEQYPLIK